MEDLDKEDEDLLNFFDDEHQEDGYDSADEILNTIDEAITKKVEKERKVKKKIAGNQKDKLNPGNKKNDDYKFLGITIGSPVVRESILHSRTEGRKLVKISRIQSTMRNNDIEGDWITIAVLVKKVTQKKTSTGSNFSVWQLSDLGMGTENLTVGFFLFGDVCKEHWKLQVGTVIGLLNPTIMKQEKDSHKEISITIDNPKKLMEIGISNDLGTCKGIRKSDGRKCCFYVNKRYGDFCEYHVQRQFKKAKHQRTELQSGGVGPNVKSKQKKNNMYNIRKDISSGSVHYGGRTVFLSEQKKDTVKLKSRPAKKNYIPNDRKPTINPIYNEKERGDELMGGTEDFKHLLECPTVGSRNLMHLLKGNQIKEEEVLAPKKAVKSAKEFLFVNKTELLTTNKNADEKSQTKKAKNNSPIGKSEKIVMNKIPQLKATLKIKEEQLQTSKSKVKEKTTPRATKLPGRSIIEQNVTIKEEKSQDINSSNEEKTTLKRDNSSNNISNIDEKSILKDERSRHKYSNIKKKSPKTIPNKTKHNTQNLLLKNNDRAEKNKKLFDFNFLETESKQDLEGNKTKSNSKSSFIPIISKANLKNDNSFSENKNKTCIDNKNNIKNKFVPKLGRGFLNNSLFEEEDDDEFNYNIFTGEEEKSQPKFHLKNTSNETVGTEKKKSPKSSAPLSNAKKNAIALIQLTGGLEKQDPNQVPGKSKKRKSIDMLEKVERCIQQEEDKEVVPSSKKRKGLLSGVLGEIDMNSKEGEKLRNQQSRNVGMLKLAEAEREERYFNTLEKKEQMEQKMLQTFELKVKGYACKLCDYVSDSRSKMCLEQKHQVAVIPNVVKRFFKCKQCKWRCHAFNRLLPKDPCKKCGERDFVKAAMVEERKGPKLGAETLEVRGEERKYLNSLY